MEWKKGGDVDCEARQYIIQGKDEQTRTQSHSVSHHDTLNRLHLF